MDRAIAPASTNFTVSFKRRLELNVTTTLFETALTYVTSINDRASKRPATVIRHHSSCETGPDTKSQ
ncbi:hypothetical protein CF326_g9980, partial [Tilletia indica]